MVKVLIWPVVLYGCETWTLLQDEINRLQALEMWIWRQLEKIKWDDKITNEEVLRRVDESKCLMKTIWVRKKNWIGHVLRGDGLLKDVLEGRMSGNRRRGRKIEKMLDDLMKGASGDGRKDMGDEERLTYQKLKKRCEDRDGWRRWVPRTCPRAENS